MRIGILTDVLDRERSKTGVPLYIRYLIPRLSEEVGQDALYLIHYRKKRESKDSIYERGQEIVVSASFLPVCVRQIYIILVKLLPVLKKNKIDAIHLLAPTFPDMLVFFLPGFKKILTVHDLYEVTAKFKLGFSCLQIRRWTSQKIRLFLYCLLKGRVDQFITVSENTKKDLIKHLKIPAEKIQTVHSGLSEHFKRIEASSPDYVDGPFILAHRPSPQLIEIFYELKKRDIKHKLVIFRQIPEFYKGEIMKLIGKFQLEKEIILAGFVPDEELMALYNTADLFISYATYEGFGFTPLEAMACGCPVVASDISSLPEVVGDAGILVENDTKKWAEAIYKVLSDKKLREKLIQKGLERITKFSWEDTANAVCKIYKEVTK